MMNQMPERITTSVLRRLTLESGYQEDISQSMVAGGTVDILTPLLEQGLADGSQVRIPPTQYWFSAREASANLLGAGLRVQLGAVGSGSDPIIEMTLQPPTADGEPAIVMTSIGGWIQAVSDGHVGDRPTADRIANELADLEKCLSWTWLELRGYATRLTDLGGPLEVLFSAGGGMLTAVVQEPGQPPEVCFLAQNTPEAVRRLPPVPEITLHARLFKVGAVHLVPLVAQIGDTWYESWINPSADQGRGLEELEILAEQDRVVFLIYDGASLDPEHTVQLANPLAADLDRMRRVMRGAPSWTADEFADARDILYAAYPTPQDLIHGPDLPPQ